MNTVKQDVKSIISNSVSVPLALGATALKVTADTAEYTNKSIGATPAVIKAILQAPFAAAKGYIMEAEGVESEEAELRAYRYVKQDLSTTIEEAGEGAGKLLAELLKEDLDSVPVVDKK